MFSTCALCIVGGIVNYYSLRRWLEGDYFVFFIRSFVSSLIYFLFLLPEWPSFDENEFGANSLHDLHLHIFQNDCCLSHNWNLGFWTKSKENEKHFALSVFTCCFVICQSAAFLSPYFWHSSSKWSALLK